MHKVPASLLLLPLFFYACAARAQTTNSSIKVTDSSKTTVAEPKTGAINLGTNFRDEARSNRAHQYTLANLAIGTSGTAVKRPGLKRLTRPELEPRAQNALAVDFEMAVGL